MQTLPPDQSTLSIVKKTTFALLVTTSVLIAIECLLAICGVRGELEHRDPFIGFESRIPLFVESTVDGGTEMRTAANKLAYFNSQQFSKQKSPGTIRVFCLGGSTTFGRPYDDRTSYAAWLRELLPLADSQTRWEVINAGGVSYASYRVASVMDELVNYEPDLFIVYTGHNEFLEERTYTDLKEDARARRRLTTLLNRSRIFSLARELTRTDGPVASASPLLPAEVDAILDHSVGPESYHRDDQLRQQIAEHFQFNLQRMVQTARRAGAQVIFITPAANLKDFSPFKSEFSRSLNEEQSLAWSRLVDDAKKCLAAGDPDRALSMLNQAEAIDHGRADLHFLVGQAMFALGRLDEARAAFQRAVNEDTCPLRSPIEFQQIVEQTAVNHRVPLVDFNSILMGACLQQHGHPCPGNEYFVDHVHPTVSSHRLLSLAVIQAMTQSGITGDSQLSDEMIATVTHRIDSTIDPELQARALTNLAQVLSWAGKQVEAGPIAERAVEFRAQTQLREDPEGMFYAAVSYAVKGQDQEAIDLLQKVARMEPDNAQARWRLASLLYDHNRFEESVEHFQAAVVLDPEDSFSFRMLGSALFQLERYEDAIHALNHAIERWPEDRVIQRHIEEAKSKLGGG